MAKKKPKTYKPPAIVGDVDAIPAPRQHRRGHSIYDDIILAAVDKPGRYLAVDPMGRTVQAFRNALSKRLDYLANKFDNMDMDVDIKQRGKYVYIRYNGETEGIADMVTRVREETRAQYGDSVPLSNQIQAW